MAGYGDKCDWVSGGGMAGICIGVRRYALELSWSRLVYKSKSAFSGRGALFLLHLAERPDFSENTPKWVGAKALWVVQLESEKRCLNGNIRI